MSDLSYLEEEAPLATQVNAAIEKCGSLKMAMDLAEEAYNKARQDYEHYAYHVLPDIFHANGITAFTGENGVTVKLKRVIHASIVKKYQDNVANWLNAHDLGHLVSTEIVVGPSAIPDLERLGIPFAERQEVNTIRVKTAIKDDQELLNNLPQGLSWYEHEEASF